MAFPNAIVTIQGLLARPYNQVAYLPGRPVPNNLGLLWLTNGLLSDFVFGYLAFQVRLAQGQLDYLSHPLRLLAPGGPPALLLGHPGAQALGVEGFRSATWNANGHDLGLRCGIN